MTEEVRIPVEMSQDGRHAFTLTSDPEHGAHAPLFNSSMAAAAAAATAAAANEAEVEAAVLKGMAEAKAALAEELRAAAKAAN